LPRKLRLVSVSYAGGAESKAGSSTWSEMLVDAAWMFGFEFRSNEDEANIVVAGVARVRAPYFPCAAVGLAVVNSEGDSAVVPDLDSSLRPKPLGLSLILDPKGVTATRTGETGKFACKGGSLRRLSLRTRNMIITERSASAAKGAPMIAPSGSDREDDTGMADVEVEEVNVRVED